MNDDIHICRMEITPAKAMEYLQHAFENQRALRPATVARYAQIMRRGTWDADGLLRLCMVEDQEYLIDGQHRLAAVVKSGIPQMFLIQRQTVPDIETAARIYTLIDKGLARTIADDLRALGVADTFQLTHTQANALAAGVALISSGFRKTDQKVLHPDDRMRMMEEYLPAYHKYLRVTSGAERIIRRRLERSATVAVGIVTFRYSILEYSTVPDFWSGVAFDDGVPANDPRKYCNRHLMLVGMTGGGASSDRFIKHKTSAVSAREIASYFNAYVEQREVKQSAKVLDPYKPIVIAGSPFDGK